jgi:hypothetical protein
MANGRSFSEVRYGSFLRGRAEALEPVIGSRGAEVLAHPTVDVPRGSSPQRRIAHDRLLGFVVTGTTPVHHPVELESTPRKFQQRVRRASTAHTWALGVVSTP